MIPEGNPRKIVNMITCFLSGVLGFDSAQANPKLVLGLFCSELILLVVARKLTTSREMLLWMTPSEAPKALQASECSELLDPMRASCWISAQH